MSIQKENREFEKRKQYFYEFQNYNSKKKYIELLKATGSFSRLFAESDDPFLHYRSMENIFCLAFSAENLSRSDVSVDAAKNRLGIGLKTFLHKNGKTFQKIAEFNKISYLFRNLSNLELIQKVSHIRNERLNVTKSIFDLDNLIYHFITREAGKMIIYEDIMSFIELKKVVIKSEKDNSVDFSDGNNEYRFLKSKNTLFMLFDTTKLEVLDEIHINIKNNPYELLLNMNRTDNIELKYGVAEKSTIESKLYEYNDCIVLPLYSERSNIVEEKSGLNMWNAKGRPRNLNEVYIPIPKWIHKYKKGFFDYKDNDNRTNSFNVRLPNKKILKMKVTQQNGKALQSDPNKALGEWILREVLKLPPSTLVTKLKLDEIGIDSIKLTKINHQMYQIDFLQTGSFEKFKKETHENKIMI